MSNKESKPRECFCSNASSKKFQLATECSLGLREPGPLAETQPIRVLQFYTSWIWRLVYMISQKNEQTMRKCLLFEHVLEQFAKKSVKKMSLFEYIVGFKNAVECGTLISNFLMRVERMLLKIELSDNMHFGNVFRL